MRACTSHVVCGFETCHNLSMVSESWDHVDNLPTRDPASIMDRCCLICDVFSSQATSVCLDDILATFPDQLMILLHFLGEGSVYNGRQRTY